MKLYIHTFAMLTEHFPRKFEIEVCTGMTVSQVLDTLSEKERHLETLLLNCKFVVGDDFVESDYELKNGDELYFLPPSSGG